MAETERRCILVADDNEINRALLKALLEHRGFEVTLVSDGLEVLPALSTRVFDLVVLDCMMPGMDGFEATRAIRRYQGDEFEPGIPILATTALASESDRRKCLAAGMNAYLAKPIKAQALYDQIETLLENRSAGTGGGEAAPPSHVEDILDNMSDAIQRDLNEWRAALSALADQGAWPKIGSLAHKIRGLSDLMGALEVSALATELEAAAEEDPNDRAGDLTRRLIAALTAWARDLGLDR